MHRGLFHVLSILLFNILATSCQQKRDYRIDYENLLSENKALIEERENLKSKIQDLRSEIGDFEDSYKKLRDEVPDCSTYERHIEFLKQSVEIYRLNYENYRYGEGICITRNGNRICGAEMVIDYLNDHYCP